DAFGSDIVETMLALRLGEFTPASVVAPDLVPEVDAFFDRALAVDRSRRFLSAVEMAEAFAETAELQVTTVRKLTASTRQLLGEHAVTTTVVLPIAPTLRASFTNETERLPSQVDLRPQSIPPDDRPPDVQPPLEEETFSATARETRFAPHGRRSRVALGAVAVLALVAGGFALRTSAEPVGAGAVAAPMAVAVPEPTADRPAVETAATAPAAAPDRAAPSAAPSAPAAVEAAIAEPAEEAASSAKAFAPPPRPFVHPIASVGFAAARASAAARPPATKPGCNPPYTVDPDGTRHVIRACL
ncbi:MAG TPA: hypothetical protein VGM56_09960, partial [Byssovorax sp.]